MSQDSRIFIVNTDRRTFSIEVIVDSTLRAQTPPGATSDAGGVWVKIGISSIDADDHECTEPDELVRKIVEIAAIHFHNAFTAEQRQQLRAEIHEWLCDRRADASLRDQD